MYKKQKQQQQHDVDHQQHPSNVFLNPFRFLNLNNNNNNNNNGVRKTNRIHSLNERRIFDSKTMAKRARNSSMKRRADNGWESENNSFIDCKKRRLVEEQYQEQQETEFAASSSMVGNEGVIAAKYKGKARKILIRSRFRPYYRPTTRKGMSRNHN